MLAYVLPVAVAIALLALLAFLLPRWRRRRAAGTDPATGRRARRQRGRRARLDDELARYGA